MEEIFKLVVDNGLGIGSFIALLYFVFTYVKELNETMTKITSAMSQVQVNSATMADRIGKIEEKINVKEG